MKTGLSPLVAGVLLAAPAMAFAAGAAAAKAPKLICKPEIQVTGRDTGRRVCATFAEWRHFRVMRARARHEAIKSSDFNLRVDPASLTPSPHARSGG